MRYSDTCFEYGMRHNFAAVMFYDRTDGRHSVALGYAD